MTKCYALDNNFSVVIMNAINTTVLLRHQQKVDFLTSHPDSCPTELADAHLVSPSAFFFKSSVCGLRFMYMFYHITCCCVFMRRTSTEPTSSLTLFLCSHLDTCGEFALLSFACVRAGADAAPMWPEDRAGACLCTLCGGLFSASEI